jgi:hypothetical protein
MRTFLTVAALAATTAFATPAFAQSAPVTSSDSIEARALLIQPATIQRVDDLSFGTIVATPSASGNVTIDANTGLRVVGAGLTGSVSDQGKRGRFIGNGVPLSSVDLTAVFPSVLVNTADNSAGVTFSGGSLDLASASGTRVIGPTGVFYVGVGGTITIATNQMPGLYTGTVTLTADFQ